MLINNETDAILFLSYDYGSYARQRSLWLNYVNDNVSHLAEPFAKFLIV